MSGSNSSSPNRCGARPRSNSPDGSQRSSGGAASNPSSATNSPQHVSPPSRRTSSSSTRASTPPLRRKPESVLYAIPETGPWWPARSPSAQGSGPMTMTSSVQVSQPGPPTASNAGSNGSHSNRCAGDRSTRRSLRTRTWTSYSHRRPNAGAGDLLVLHDGPRRAVGPISRRTQAPRRRTHRSPCEPHYRGRLPDHRRPDHDRQQDQPSRRHAFGGTFQPGWGAVERVHCGWRDVVKRFTSSGRRLRARSAVRCRRGARSQVG